DPCVLWNGRLDANKDPLTILEAVRIASSDLPDLQLWCAYTDAPLLHPVNRRLEEDPRLAARVHLVGTVTRAQIELMSRAADVFVIGSHREATCYALIEALACGTPPVVSDIPTFRAIVGDIGA